MSVEADLREEREEVGLVLASVLVLGLVLVLLGWRLGLGFGSGLREEGEEVGRVTRVLDVLPEVVVRLLYKERPDRVSSRPV